MWKIVIGKKKEDSGYKSKVEGLALPILKYSTNHNNFLEV